MKNLQNLEAGDLITDGTHFRRILARLGGEGELTTYAVSCKEQINGEKLKEAGANATAYEFSQCGYSPYILPEDKTEKLVERTDTVKIENWSGDAMLGGAFKINGRSYSAKEIIQALDNLDQVPF